MQNVIACLHGTTCC